MDGWLRNHEHAAHTNTNTNTKNGVEMDDHDIDDSWKCP